MKILWLNSGLLLPLDKGGKLRTWHLMRHLALQHDITYLSFAERDQRHEDRVGMREVCNALETVPRTDPAKGTLAFYADAAKHVVAPLPYAVGKYRSAEYAAQVRRLLESGGFDVVVADFLPPVANLPRRLSIPSVLFTHNVEAEIWRRHAENASNPFSRALMTQQWNRMLRFEREALSRFDLVLAVSDADSQTFGRLYPGALRRPVHVVQTGVDTSYFTPMPGNERRAHLVFTGSMDWLPNEDGMLYFVREILPRIRQVEPEVTLSIIGRAPTPAVKRLAEENGIQVTGRVDDVRPHVAKGDVYVVPLRIGGGTRLKIFEAMSMAKAVVATTVGAEGLPVTSGRDVVLADEPARFAEAVVHLIRDEGARRQIESAARQLVVEKYDWAAVAQDFEDALVAVRRDAGPIRLTA
ncbi:MAG: glycosyltransferase family 4 protein [Acidobacteriota bacterium]|nr:glycosyltransferase family 4 protein [Acidobacteriota bacterium]